MPDESIEISGRTVISEKRDDSSTARLTIDGREIQVEFDADTAKYSTVAMPYRDYESLNELVESLIAHHPDFRDPRP